MVAGRSEGSHRSSRVLWTSSIIVSLLLLVALALAWQARTGTEIETAQLTDAVAVESFLDMPSRGYPDALMIPTGVFIESLEFLSATDVQMTGYVWQRWPEDGPTGIAQGFVLPDFVATVIAGQEEYRILQDGHELVGWYFEGVFRQPFDYGDYPFDHKTVRLRIWPRDFGAAVVLVPDFDGYPATGPEDVFGIDVNIVLGSWTRENTYFDYLEPVYNTDFGIDGWDDAGEIPEMRFNVVLRRNFADPFIVNIVPLAVVAALAFGTVLTVTRDESKASIIGFNLSGVFATVSALFFVILIAHVQLRSELPGVGLVYFEYLYFIMYLILLAVAIDAHQTIIRPSGTGSLAAYGENLLVAILFWPILIGSVLVVTMVAV